MLVTDTDEIFVDPRRSLLVSLLGIGLAMVGLSHVGAWLEAAFTITGTAAHKWESAAFSLYLPFGSLAVVCGAFFAYAGWAVGATHMRTRRLTIAALIVVTLCTAGLVNAQLHRHDAQHPLERLESIADRFVPPPDARLIESTSVQDKPGVGTPTVTRVWELQPSNLETACKQTSASLAIFGTNLQAVGEYDPGSGNTQACSFTFDADNPEGRVEASVWALSHEQLKNVLVNREINPDHRTLILRVTPY